MYDERVSQEDMDSVYEQGYKKGYEDGVESERPRAFGAGYKAGYDNAAKIVRCKECKYWKTFKFFTQTVNECAILEGRNTEADDYCSYGEHIGEYKESEE